MKATRKSNQPIYDGKRALVVKIIAAEYEVTEAYVRMAIKGDRASEKAEEIKRAYNAKYQALTQAIA